MFNQRKNGQSRAWFLIPLIGILAVIGVAAVFFFYGPQSTGVYPYYGWWFPFPWFFIVPIIFLIFFGFRWFLWGGWGGGWYYRQYNDPAVEIAKERFARGEITQEQFEQIAKDLERH